MRVYNAGQGDETLQVVSSAYDSASMTIDFLEFEWQTGTMIKMHRYQHGATSAWTRAVMWRPVTSQYYGAAETEPAYLWFVGQIYTSNHAGFIQSGQMSELR